MALSKSIGNFENQPIGLRGTVAGLSIRPRFLSFDPRDQGRTPDAEGRAFGTSNP